MLHIGGTVLLSVKGLERWVEQRAQAETAQAEAEADALLRDPP